MMTQQKPSWTVQSRRIQRGWTLQENIEQKASYYNSYLPHGFLQSNTEWQKPETSAENSDRRYKTSSPCDHESENLDVKIINRNEAILCNSKGFSRFVRHCDDKSLNILANPKLFEEKEENNNIVVACDSLVELKNMNKVERPRTKYTSDNSGFYKYHFEEKAISETRKSSMGFPDSLFLTQIYNQAKYNSVDDCKYRKSKQIFSARGMCTTSLCTRKILPNPNFSYWTYCTRCETVFDTSSHSPGDYKNILIDSKLLCIIGWDKDISRQFNLSFRRLQGGYARQYTSHLIGPNFSNDNSNSDNNSQFKNSNVQWTQYGIALSNSKVFGGIAVDTGLANTVFDCVLLDYQQTRNNNGTSEKNNNNNESAKLNDNNNNNNINISLLLVCKALCDEKHCFEFIKIKLTFSDGYKHLLSCVYQRENNVSINNNLKLKKMFNLKSESLFGWDNKTARFKTECVKIKNETKQKRNVLHDRLLIIVVNTSSHHIILYNYDLNNYVILKLNSIINMINNNSNEIFPYVCCMYHNSFSFFFFLFLFFFLIEVLFFLLA